MNKRRYFGTDGVRGKVGEEPITPETVLKLGWAARARAGIVTSASHNPYDDNGIKFFSSEGTKLPDDVELAIEDMMQQPLTTAGPDALGKAKRYDDAGGRYIEFCHSTFPHRLNLEGLKIVVDCANGAAYHIAPLVFSELGAEVIAVANEPDGFNINRHC